MPCTDCSSALFVLRLEKDPVPLDLSLNIVNCVLTPSAFLPQQCHDNFKFTYFSSVYLHQQSAHCKSLRKTVIFALENPCESPFAIHCKTLQNHKLRKLAKHCMYFRKPFKYAFAGILRFRKLSQI